MGRLVVVFGPNESGKSTFFNFAQSMIYGFSPAARGTHPYSPWSGAHIEGHIDGHLDSGDPFSVRRRLRSSPWGRLDVAGEETELRNRPVPFVEHVPAPVFGKLFALTLDQLAALDRTTWGALQDRLLASMVLDDLLPAKDVAGVLRSDARALWRPDNRGQPQDRKITAQIKELQGARRAAADRDAVLRRNQGDLEATRIEYATLRERRDVLADLLRGLDRLVPANKRLRRLREAREQSAQAGAADDLPEHPSDIMDRLESDLVRFERDAKRIAARGTTLKTAIEGFSAQDQELVGLSAALRSQQASFEMIPAVEARLDDAREALSAAQDRLSPQLDALFGPGTEVDSVQARLAEIPLDEVDRAFGTIATLEQAPNASFSSVTPLRPTPLIESVGLAALAMIAGVILLLVSSARGGVIPSAFGGALIVFAMFALVLSWDRRRRGSSANAAERAAAESSAQAATVALEEARQRVRALLAPLPLRPELSSDPRPELTATLRALSGLGLDRDARKLALSERLAELKHLRAATDPLLEAVGYSRTDGALELFRALDGAEHRGKEHQRATLALRELDRETRDLTEERDGARQTLDRLRSRLAEIGDGSVERGLKTVAMWRSATRRTLDLERDFRRDWGEPDDVAAEIIAFNNAHSGLELEAASQQSVRADLDDVTRRLETIGGQVHRLDGEVRHLEGGDTPSEIDGRIAALADERAALRRERDRLEMLGHIVEEAERRFKEHHQPDVLERSATYLSGITNGRYRRLLPAHEGKDGVLSLETSDGRPVGLGEALSRGTKEQVLLSLRLAAADHMDQAGERLPLFVDEVFVNWDRGRRDRGLELLRQLSSSRQVFVFTCHADVAERLASLGSRVFELPTS